MFTRHQSQEQYGFNREEVTLSYFGRYPRVLRDLMDECRHYYMALVEHKTCVFKHEIDRWKAFGARSKRNAATVVIKEELKKMVLNDVAEFLDPQTRAWYKTRSLPYQRGYLFLRTTRNWKNKLQCLRCRAIRLRSVRTQHSQPQRPELEKPLHRAPTTMSFSPWLLLCGPGSRAGCLHASGASLRAAPVEASD